MKLPVTQSSKYIAVLASVAVGVLILGTLLRPRETPVNPTPVPSEADLMQLARRADRRSLDGMMAYFEMTAADVESSVVRLPGTSASGVVWDERLVVTAPLPRHGSEAATIRNSIAEGPGRSVIWGPHMPLAAVEPNGLQGLVPARRPSAPGQAGDWIIAVWRTDRERAFAPGHFLQVEPVMCGLTMLEEVEVSLTLTRAMVGGGLFDIDGNLRAIILPCNSGFTAASVSSIQAMLDHASTLEQRLVASCGLVAGEMSDAEMAHFKATGGVIVRGVWRGSPAEKAGLMPGDIIGAVADTAVVALDDLRVLTSPTDGQSFELALRRGSRALTLEYPQVPVQASPEAGSPRGGTGLVLESPQEGYRIDAVLPESPAALAGVEKGDRLIRINQAEPRDVAQVRRVLGGGTALPVFIEVERDSRRLGMLVQ